MITIEEAIARIPEWRGAAVVSVTPLAGGITNSNYRVEAAGETFVVHIAGAGAEMLGIDHERAYRCAVAAAQTGVGPMVVHASPADGILVTRFISGPRLTAGDLARPEILERLIRSVRRYHAGPAFPGQFSSFRTLEAYLEVARRHGAPLPDDIEWMYARLTAVEAAAGRGGAVVCPCHNDLWSPNLIDDGESVRILDWEYAGMGDVYFDLANLAMHHVFTDAQSRALLRAYFGMVSDGGFTRLQALRIAAELREAMWAMVALNLTAGRRAGFDCRGYASTHFDRYRQALRDPRLPDWLGGPAPDE